MSAQPKTLKIMIRTVMGLIPVPAIRASHYFAVLDHSNKMVPRYSITHVPTGLNVARFHTRKAVMAALEDCERVAARSSKVLAMSDWSALKPLLTTRRNLRAWQRRMLQAEQHDRLRRRA